MTTPDTPKKTRVRGRGFALLDQSAMRTIASLGGKTAHAEGRAHQFTNKEARAAAAKSVEVRRARKLHVAAEAGRLLEQARKIRRLVGLSSIATPDELADLDRAITALANAMRPQKYRVFEVDGSAYVAATGIRAARMHFRKQHGEQVGNRAEEVNLDWKVRVADEAAETTLSALVDAHLTAGGTLPYVIAYQPS